MARKDTHDVIKVFHRLTDAAEAYVNRSPRVQRIQTERAALLEAIADAQLVLSVHRLPKEPVSERPIATRKDNGKALEKELKKTRAALQELQRRVRPVSGELQVLHTRAHRAKVLLDTALAEHDAEGGIAQKVANPFHTAGE